MSPGGSRGSHAEERVKGCLSGSPKCSLPLTTCCSLQVRGHVLNQAWQLTLLGLGLTDRRVPGCGQPCRTWAGWGLCSLPAGRLCRRLSWELPGPYRDCLSPPAGHQGSFCMLCVMQNHIIQAFANSGNAIKPVSFIRDLRSKSGFLPGRVALLGGAGGRGAGWGRAWRPRAQRGAD